MKTPPQYRKTNGIKALLLLFSTLGLEQLKIIFNVGNSNALDFRKGKDSYLTKYTNISIDWIKVIKIAGKQIVCSLLIFILDL